MFFFSSIADQHNLHSFPTRRSSDLEITRQYMRYIELMQDLQLELAGEYLVMAATLAEIKSRMLLPRPKIAGDGLEEDPDRKSTRLNSSHPSISYAVFCLKKKKERI